MVGYYSAYTSVMSLYGKQGYTVKRMYDWYSAIHCIFIGECIALLVDSFLPYNIVCCIDNQCSTITTYFYVQCLMIRC